LGGGVLGFADVILFVVLAISLLTDIRQRKILNIVTLPAMVVGVFYSVVSQGIRGFGMSCAGLVAGIALLFIPFLMGGIGAGDVKLLGAVGALKGPVFVFYSGLASAIAGGIIAVVILICRRRFYKVLKNTTWGFVTLRTEFLTGKTFVGGAFPYGIAIVAGTVFTLLTRWNQWLY